MKSKKRPRDGAPEGSEPSSKRVTTRTVHESALIAENDKLRTALEHEKAQGIQLQQDIDKERTNNEKEVHRLNERVEYFKDMVDQSATGGIGHPTELEVAQKEIKKLRAEIERLTQLQTVAQHPRDRTPEPEPEPEPVPRPDQDGVTATVAQPEDVDDWSPRDIGFQYHISIASDKEVAKKRAERTVFGPLTQADIAKYEWDVGTINENMSFTGYQYNVDKTAIDKNINENMTATER